MSQISNSAVHKANIVNLSQSGLVQFYYMTIGMYVLISECVGCVDSRRMVQYI